MDLSTIQMHLDNFVDTWKGWGLVFQGLDAWIATVASRVLTRVLMTLSTTSSTAQATFLPR